MDIILGIVGFSSYHRFLPRIRKIRWWISKI